MISSIAESKRKLEVQARVEQLAVELKAAEKRPDEKVEEEPFPTVSPEEKKGKQKECASSPVIDSFVKRQKFRSMTRQYEKRMSLLGRQVEGLRASPQLRGSLSPGSELPSPEPTGDSDAKAALGYLKKIHELVLCGAKNR